MLTTTTEITTPLTTSSSSSSSSTSTSTSTTTTTGTTATTTNRPSTTSTTPRATTTEETTEDTTIALKNRAATTEVESTETSTVEDTTTTESTTTTIPPDTTTLASTTVTPEPITSPPITDTSTQPETTETSTAVTTEESKQRRRRSNNDYMIFSTDIEKLFEKLKELDYVTEFQKRKENFKQKKYKNDSENEKNLKYNVPNNFKNEKDFTNENTSVFYENINNKVKKKKDSTSRSKKKRITILKEETKMSRNYTITDYFNTTSNEESNLKNNTLNNQTLAATINSKQFFVSKDNSHLKRNSDVMSLTSVHSSKDSFTHTELKEILKNSSENIAQVKLITATTEGPNERLKRSLVDYYLARYYDDNHDIAQFHIPSFPNQPPPRNINYSFLVNGKYEETGVNFMTYDVVLPFYYIRNLNSLALKFPLDSPKYYLLLILPVDSYGINKLICDIDKTVTLKQIVLQMRPTFVKAVIPSFMLRGFVILTSTLQKVSNCYLCNFSLCFKIVKTKWVSCHDKY